MRIIVLGKSGAYRPDATIAMKKTHITRENKQKYGKIKTERGRGERGEGGFKP